MYGIPHGWGANLLMWRQQDGQAGARLVGRVFDTSSPYKGKVTAYDSPIYIADAALYLKTTKPDSGIKDPYALDEKQFDAAVDLLKKQRERRRVLGDYTKEVSRLRDRRHRVGTTWQVIANSIDGDGKTKVETVVPKEGATGWSDTWMIAAKAKHPNCTYKWIDWIVSPEGERPGGGVLRRGAGADVRRASNVGQEVLHQLPRPRRRPTRTRSATGRRRSRSASTTAARSARTTPHGRPAWTAIKG